MNIAVRSADTQEARAAQARLAQARALITDPQLQSFFDALFHGALPDDVLIFLLGSRYCDTDRLATEAWKLFGQIPPGWPRAQAILTQAEDLVEAAQSAGAPLVGRFRLGVIPTIAPVLQTSEIVD